MSLRKLYVNISLLKEHKNLSKSGNELLELLKKLGNVKHKLQVASCEFRYTSYELKATSTNSNRSCTKHKWHCIIGFLINAAS